MALDAIFEAPFFPVALCHRERPRLEDLAAVRRFQRVQRLLQPPRQGVGPVHPAITSVEAPELPLFDDPTIFRDGELRKFGHRKNSDLRGSRIAIFRVPDAPREWITGEVLPHVQLAPGVVKQV